jgi:hypothetical protein
MHDCRTTGWSRLKLTVKRCGCCPAGELSERVNADIAPHGLIAKYMHPTNREGRLERCVLLRERRLDERLPVVLVEMTLRAGTELEEAEGTLAKLEEELIQQLMCTPGVQVGARAARQTAVLPCPTGAGMRAGGG